MPSTLENQFLTALSRGELIVAHGLLEQLSAESDENHVRFLRAHYQAHLSPRNLPDSFSEMMEAAATPGVSLKTALYACVEGSKLAFLLFDTGRMWRVMRLFKALRDRHRDDPALAMWTGPILLNQANLAAHIGASNVIPLYRAAAKALDQYERFWCLSIAAFSRLAMMYEYAGRPRMADKALVAAQSRLRDDLNRQEYLLAKARILLNRGLHEEGLAAASQAYPLAQRLGDQIVLVEVLRCAGEALHALGRRDEATLRLSEGRAGALAHRLYFLLDGAFLGLAAR